MPRIIDVDTEAFAPTYQKAYREREPIGDVQTRRMMADLQLAGQAMPFISEGIKGIDQYLVTPIQQALKAGREEEYKGKKAGEGLLEPGETTMQRIARERLRPKESLEAQKPSYIGGEEAAKMFGEERPEFGELEVPVGEAKAPDVSTTALIEKQREEQLAAQRLKEQAQAKLASLPEEAARRAAAESRYMPSLVPIRPTTEADQQRFAANVAEALKARPQATAPTEPTPTRMMPEHPVPTGYQWPARGRLTAAGKPEEGFAGAEAPTEPTQTAQMAKMAATTARGGAPAAAEPAEPARPKTLATATDDELDMAKRKLENLVKQNPEDKELADRLEMVNLEQRHRGEKMEYEDWAAQARAADTLEEQRRVLEMAKNVRMPVEGLEGLLRSPFERAKLKALGSREEKGLFPEVARPLNEWEIQKKEVEIRIAQLKAQGVPEKQAAEQALAEKRRADAGLARARTKTEETLLEPRYAAAAEKPHLMHSQEEHLKNMDDIAKQKAPAQIKEMQARTDKLLADARRPRGGGGRSKDDLLKAIDIAQREDQTNIKNVDQMFRDARATYSTILAQAKDDERDANVANKDYEAELKAGAGLYGEERAKHDREVAKLKRVADAAKEKARLSREQSDEALTMLHGIDDQRAAAMETSRQNQGKIELLWQEYFGRRKLPYVPRRVTPVAPPASKTEQEGGFMDTVREILGGGATTATTPAPTPAAAAPAPTAPAPTTTRFRKGDRRQDTQGRTIVFDGKNWVYED